MSRVSRVSHRESRASLVCDQALGAATKLGCVAGSGRDQGHHDLGQPGLNHRKPCDVGT